MVHFFKYKKSKYTFGSLKELSRKKTQQIGNVNPFFSQLKNNWNNLFNSFRWGYIGKKTKTGKFASFRSEFNDSSSSAEKDQTDNFKMPHQRCLHSK